MGGKTEVQPLSAAACARAIVAAAAVFGDDPMRAAGSKRGPGRRAMTAAAAGVSGATGRPYASVAVILGLSPANLGRARAQGGLRFAEAEAAARRAAAGPVVKAATAPANAPAAARPVAETEAATRSPTEAFARLRTAAGRKTRTLTAGAARREVLRVLALEPCAAPDLMEILELGEGQIRQALQQLEDMGEVCRHGGRVAIWAAQTWAVADA